jgi:hypothetical protein
MGQYRLKLSHVATMIGATALLSAPALARDVTVYGGGKSKTYSTQERSAPNVIAGGKDRVTSIDRRVDRFAMERNIQSILDKRDTEEARETSDAMMRIIVRGNKDATREYSRYFPYHVRSADFYAQLKQRMREQEAGVRVYRQSVLDDVPSEDWIRVAKAMNDLK